MSYTVPNPHALGGIPMTVDMIVMGQGSGGPDYLRFEVECTRGQYDHGDHYDHALQMARQTGGDFDPVMAVDQFDPAWRMLGVDAEARPALRIVQTIQGGVVDQVLCTEPAQILTIDYDTDDAVRDGCDEGEFAWIPQTGGPPQRALVSARAAESNAQRVQALWGASERALAHQQQSPPDQQSAESSRGDQRERG